MGGGIPEQVILGCIEKQSKQAIGIKPVISIPLWFLFHFLPQLSSVTDCMQKRWNKWFYPQTILGHDAYHNNRTQTKTQIDMKKWAVAVVDLTMFEGLWKDIKFNDIKPLP